MSVIAIIHQAQNAGVALRVVGGKLKAVGKLSVVQSWAPRLREHKLELIEALAANDPNPPPEPPPDPNAWRELAAAYHLHHFKCSTCIAAGRGVMYGLRCGTGAALWVNYQNTRKTTS